ncbi:hypothetical protein HY636_05895 [Candidatus Woesearchaeota archaeon]|nr:hypothetical protein [Candidatus Woesearchaeota archaeon]
MMYQNESVYVRVHERTERTFSFHASRSLLANNSIDALVSNYIGSSSSSQPLLSSSSSYVDSASSKPQVYNLDAPLPFLGSVESQSTHPRLLEYKRQSNARNTNSTNGHYASFNYNPSNYLAASNPQGYFAAENFLHIYRPDTQFIDEANDVQEFVKEAFRATTGEELPPHIKITVCNEEKFKLLHTSKGGKWSKGIQGFSVHLTKEIVIKQNKLDVVMLVIGHELGHVLSHPLGNMHDEEAKAFAFELEWLNSIKKHNIANLADNINIDFQPANNGLHDVAFNFVKKLVSAGKRAMDVFNGLISGDVSMQTSLVEY